MENYVLPFEKFVSLHLGILLKTNLAASVGVLFELQRLEAMRRRNFCVENRRTVDRLRFGMLSWRPTTELSQQMRITSRYEIRKKYTFWSIVLNDDSSV